GPPCRAPADGRSTGVPQRGAQGRTPPDLRDARRPFGRSGRPLRSRPTLPRRARRRSAAPVARVARVCPLDLRTRAAGDPPPPAAAPTQPLQRAARPRASRVAPATRADCPPPPP